MRKTIHLSGVFFVVFFLFIFLLFPYSFAENRKLTAVDWFHKADALLAGGKFTDPKKVIEYLNNAIKLKPDYAMAYNKRGAAYAELGQHQRAIADYNESIRLNPDLAAVYNNRGSSYGKLGQYQHAMEDCSMAIQLKPDYAVAYYNRGSAYEKLGQYQRAIKDFNEVIRLKPDYAVAYTNRGIAYFHQEDNKLGCRDAQKACAWGSCKLLDITKGEGLCR